MKEYIQVLIFSTMSSVSRYLTDAQHIQDQENSLNINDGEENRDYHSAQMM